MFVVSWFTGLKQTLYTTRSRTHEWAEFFVTIREIMFVTFLTKPIRKVYHNFV